MKTYYFYNSLLLFLLCLGIFCSPDKDLSIGNITAPSNLTFSTNISDKGDGIVSFEASADNAIVYHYYFGLGDLEEPTLSTDGKASNIYTRPGNRNYTVRVIAYGTAGSKEEVSFNITVNVISDIPPEIIEYITGGSKKHWKWKSSVAGHLGLGEEFLPTGETNYDANWYEAGIDEKQATGCLYEDIMTFTENQDGSYSYTLDNGSGSTFFRMEAVNDALGVANPSEDRCYPFDTKGEKEVIFIKKFDPNENSTGIFMNFSNGGFMSFYLGVSEYEILKITEDELRVRVVQQFSSAASRGRFTWYHTFEKTTVTNTPEEDDVTEGEATNCPGNVAGASASGNNDVLVWEDEFNGNALCKDNWDFDIGRGQNGWGNNEEQYYTDRKDNVEVKDGVLKITAKKENYLGAAYTSARLKSQNKYDFKYGRVVIRAKVPKGGGTWAALWMLGANFPTAGWPQCGEIDIMEHVGNDPNTIIHALHYPGNSAGNANTNKNPFSSDLSADFHNYEIRWTSEKILFFVDDQQTHSFDNNANIPFNHNFFLILNIAVGGTLGSNIDPNFTSGTMEIDYVRVYQ